MLIQKEELQNPNNNSINEINQEEINNNLEEINANINVNENLNENVNQNNNQRHHRGGFDMFLSHGLNHDEVRTLRLIFHFAQAQESIMNGVPLDWSREGIYQREERWLINQLSGMLNRNGDRNSNYISLNINDESLFPRNNFGFFYENNMDQRHIFMIGFCLGLIVNVFGILLLMCRFKALFKLGLICGMIISMVFFSKIFIFNK